ncbi:MAG: DUF1553 domain-containing protein, partial [Fimbriiglobus sp.]
SHKKLSVAQKDTLRRWVTEGAEYEPHWSFQPPKRPAAPAVTAAAWVRTPVDAFVLAGLEKAGLIPAPEADRRTLARRLSLDLTGLPPTPEAVEAFVTDKSADFYEKYVDKLMASPAWGEHRGRYWLDAARYADTHGIHFDNFREMHSYRDWVINAFNRNLPFDQFTIEQLAGDLLPEPTIDQRVATGFNRCNITTNEGGVIGEEYLVLYTRDRTETVNQVWMGLTAGCAVCHDHKFDPISQKDFYAMAAFFNNTTQNAMDGNVHNTPPVITVPQAADRERLETLSAELKAAREHVDARKKAARGEFTTWLKTVDPATLADKIPTAGLVFHVPFTEGKGKEAAGTAGDKPVTVKFPGPFDWITPRGKETRVGLQLQPGGSPDLPDVGNFGTLEPFSVSAWVRNGKRNQSGAIVSRMDEADNFRGWDLWLQDDKIGAHIVSQWPDDAIKVVAKTPLKHNTWHHVTVSYDGTGKAAGVAVSVDGVPQPTAVESDTLKTASRTTSPFKLGQRSSGSQVQNVGLRDLRLYNRGLTGLDAKALAGNQRTAELAAKPADKRTAKETDELFDWWVGNLDEKAKKMTADLAALQAEEAGIRGRGTIAHIAVEKSGMAEAYILNRGEYDQRRDKVAPATPKALPAFPADLPKNRLGFAKWLLQPDHPLTARVTVNRLWQELYGAGLVRTAGDFGITGELPSHPDLLDWLAVEFREGGWDTKKFFKMLVTSAAYRQSAAITPEKLEKDRDNRLMSRGPRFRMDAEMIRDYALAASGLLVAKVGGPSVKPYQPDGVWEAVAMPNSNTRNYKRDAGESLYRRSLYTFWKRAAPPAFLDVMNAPNREVCVVRRDRTNTPLQALLTLNDVQYVEAARVLAEKAVKAAPTPAERLNFLANRVLARPLTSDEVRVLEPVFNDLLEHYRAAPADAKKLLAFGEAKTDPTLDPATVAAVTMLANQLLNLDEVLNK